MSTAESRHFSQQSKHYEKPAQPEEAPAEWTREALKHIATDEQLRFFEEQGYLIVEDAIEPGLLARLQQVCKELVDQERAVNGMSPHKMVSFVRSVAMHDIFLELLDNPRVFPLLWEILGWNIQLYISQLIDYPPEPKHYTRNTEVRGSGWHIDGGRPVPEMEMEPGKPQPRLALKVSYWLSDTSHEDSGAMLIVPGSHLSGELPNPEVLGHTAADVQGEKISPAGERTADPPGAIPLLVKAGTAVLFDRRMWHSRGRNYSDVSRQALFFGYSYRWLRGLDYNLMPESLLEKAKTPIRRQLLGDGHDIKGWWQPTDYDVPLKTWLKKHNAGRSGGPHPGSQMIFGKKASVPSPFLPARAGSEVEEQASVGGGAKPRL